MFGYFLQNPGTKLQNFFRLYFVDVCNKLDCLVHGRPFPVCVEGQEPTIQWSIRKVLRPGRLRPYSQTLDCAGKAGP
jgi:hypothetical protein